MKAAILALPFGLASPAFAQDVPEIHRAAPLDVESKVGSAAMWHIKGGNGRCSSRGTPTLHVIIPPKHGTGRFVTDDVGIPEGSGVQEFGLRSVILYTPAPGFVGQGQFIFNRARDAMTSTR